jgi:protein-tyrosine phosphatase
MKTEPTLCNPVLVHQSAMVSPKEDTSPSAIRRKELSLKRKALFAKIPKGFSEILTGKLWLGSGRDARQKNKLINLGITHIINCAIEWKNHYPSTFIYFNGNVLDNESQDLSVFFSEAFDFLDDVFKVPTNKVFIHCVVGKSRSAALTMAYLMRVEHLTLKQAFAHVRACRPIVCPNDGFMRQLMELEMQIFNTSSSSMTWGEWKIPKCDPSPSIPSPPLHQDSPSSPRAGCLASSTNPFSLLTDTENEKENFPAEQNTSHSRAHTPTPIPTLLHESCASAHAAAQHVELQHAGLSSYVCIIPELLQDGLRKVYEEDPVGILQWVHHPTCVEGLHRSLAISKDDITT